MPALKPGAIGHPCHALRCGCPLVAAAAVAEAKVVRARQAEEPWPVHAR